MIICSRFKDNKNIFHILVKEFPVIMKHIEYSKRKNLILEFHSSSKLISEYRKMLYKPFFYILDYYIESNQKINLNDFKYHILNPFKFQRLDKNDNFIDAIHYIKTFYRGKNQNSPRIIFSLRKTKRILYDSISLNPIETLIRNKYGKESIQYFEELKPEDQINVLQNCDVFCGVHGANLVNLIFTNTKAHIIEIDFRNQWNCDPVCSKHKDGTLKPCESCNGRLTRGKYHKADYHNLSYLTGRQYSSMSAVRCENYLTRNPIDVEKVYIDFHKLSICIDKALMSTTRL